MWKILLIAGIIVYVFYKIGSFLFKIGGAAQQFRENQAASNINNGRAGDKNKKRPKINAGEYIDYEEVK